MAHFSDSNGDGSESVGPRLSLDLIKSLGTRPPYFKGECYELELLLAGPHELRLTPQQVRARGCALLAALQPADFIASEGQGDDACDLYRAMLGAERLRVGVALYRFDGQPPILMVTIAAAGERDFG